MTATNIIYGLVDPKSRLIRYIGMSTVGLERPRQHRSRSCPDTYCRRWVKNLQSQGLDYEIVILESAKSPTALAAAERRWIAFGRKKGWPLTNVMPGGGPSEEAILKHQRRQEARLAARSSVIQYRPEDIEAFRLSLGVPIEIQQRCLRFFNNQDERSNAIVAAATEELCVTRAAAAHVYLEWANKPARRAAIKDLERRVDALDLGEEPPLHWPHGGQMITRSWRRDLPIPSNVASALRHDRMLLAARRS